MAFMVGGYSDSSNGHRRVPCMVFLTLLSDCFCIRVWSGVSSRVIRRFSIVLAAISALYLGGCSAAGGPTGADARSGIPISSFAPREISQQSLGVVRQPSSIVAPTTVGTHGRQPVLAPSDLVEIVVFRVPELSRTLRVEDDGTLQMPLIGRVAVAGQTPDAAAELIRSRLERDYLEEPKVTLLVRESPQRRVTIDGAVTQPGVYALGGGMTLMQAIATARGVTKMAKGVAFISRRTIDGRRQRAAFDVAAIRSGRARDPRVKAGDRVFVPASEFKTAIDSVAKFVPFAHVLLLL